MTTENQEFLNIDSQLGYDILESNKQQIKSLETQTTLLKNIAKTVEDNGTTSYELTRAVKEHNIKAAKELKKLEDLSVTDEQLKKHFGTINEHASSINTRHDKFVKDIQDKTNEINNFPQLMESLKKAVLDTLSDNYKVYSKDVLNISKDTSDLLKGLENLNYKEHIEKLNLKQDDYLKEVQTLQTDSKEIYNKVIEKMDKLTDSLTLLFEEIQKNNKEQQITREACEKVYAKLNTVSAKVDSLLLEQENVEDENEFTEKVDNEQKDVHVEQEEQ